MIVDSTILDRPDPAPVVIIGSGPAGITLARRLADKGIRSLTIEAGGEDYDPDVQDAYLGRIEGDPYYDLDATRLRQFGGTSNHWQGWCRPLDEAAFLPRDDVPDYGWPIAKAEIDPYAQEASDILEAPLARKRPLTDALEEIEFTFSPPVLFSEKFRGFYETSDTADLLLNAPVQSLIATGGRLSSVRIALPDSTTRDVTGGVFVLATGGIENSRLLLWSNEVSPEPVVRDARALGRYWMEHPHAYVGEGQLSADPFEYTSERNNQKFIGPSYAAMKQYGILNGSVRIWPVFYGEEPLRDMVKGAICKSGETGQDLAARLGQRVNCMSELQVVWEQPPVAENRVALDPDARDALGMPRPVLHWRRTPLDRRTARIIYELAGAYMVSEGLGRVRAYDHLIAEADYPDDGVPGGHHHMGGTRMAETPATGVVDRNLKIFGLENAYVAGSSVFPTGGHANPTQTIVQLSLRLGDHLATVL